MAHLSRREFLRIAAGGAAATALPAAWLSNVLGAEGERPNIVYVLCDDMGYGDLACYGSPAIKTPNLDAFAEEGVKLTDCYAGSPVCSPARAAFLTGRTPHRCGIYHVLGARSAPMHLREEELTVAALLGKAGYRTAVAGKWHLNSRFNSPGQPTPGDHGFDHWFVTENNARPSHRDPDNFVRNGKKVGKVEGYSSAIIIDEAVSWLRRRDARRPFFLYVSFHSPHDPIATPEETVRLYPGVEKNRAEYYGNITHMDREFGRLMGALDDLNLRDTTFVMFTSDNGPQTRNAYRGTHNCYGSPGPLRGMKSWLYEGGIRVPGMIRWPGRIGPGTVSHEPVSGVDMLPTLCGAAGVPVPGDRAIDGASLLPLFAGKPLERRVPLYWQWYRKPLGHKVYAHVKDSDAPKVVIRRGDWKLCGFLEPPKRGATFFFRQSDMEHVKTAKLVKYELYNLREDIAEKNDLAGKEPGRMERMIGAMKRLYAEIQAECPNWKMSGR